MDITRLTDDQRASLAERARVVCVVYADHGLPLGVEPPRGRIGVEIDEVGRATLYVERSHTYDGGSHSVRRLVDQGEHQFGSLDELVNWMTAACGTDDAPPSAGTDDPPPSAGADGRAHGELLRVLRDSVAVDVVGQDTAADLVCEVVARHVRKVEPRSPGTLLLTGPTGVGKTLTATSIAAALALAVDDTWTTFRVDMSEFEQHHRVASLLGAPPGYVGFATRPAFLTHLLAHPRTVVILDEIEKAHPDVLMTFMAAFDTGRLTPSSGGEPIDVRRCIFVCTSNLAVGELDRYRLDNPASELGEAARTLMVSAGMRPELVNRFDAVVTFEHLTDAALAALVVREIRRTGREFGIDVRRIEPGVSARVVDALPPLDRFGGRSVTRAVADVLAAVFSPSAHDGPVDLVERDAVPALVPALMTAPAPVG